MQQAKKTKCVKISITLPKVLLEKIDKDKGSVTRSRHLADLITMHYFNKGIAKGELK